MESIRCHFFNGVDNNGKKPIWVKWSKVLASKEKGGLGVSSFYEVNRALLFKWVWHFCTQGSSLWARVIKGIHGEDGKLGKNINHSHLSMWGDGAFKSLYPRVYALETCKNATVAAKMSHVNVGYFLRRIPRGEKKLDKEEFQETRSMDAFRVLKTQFQLFINFQYYFDDDDDGLMIRKYFLAYTRTEVRQFRDTLVQHMESVKKSIDERAQHKQEYDSRTNKRQMQSTEGKVDSSKALDASLVVAKCSGTKSDKQDTSSSLGNYLTHVVDADIRPVNDQVSFAEVQLTA
ncbi:hypothetical protein Tco_1568717 [Tanacetum coccineum]